MNRWTDTTPDVPLISARDAAWLEDRSHWFHGILTVLMVGNFATLAGALL
jgi:hypothetical protein